MYTLDFNNKSSGVYSEIDYFFSSGLAASSWGIDQLIKRIVLFEKTKQHIPYLILLYLVYYNADFTEKDKNQTINKLIRLLLVEVIQKTKPNPIFNFITPYFVVRLLADLKLSGYNSEILLKNQVKLYYNNPAILLFEYDNFKDFRFPEVVLSFFKACPPWPDDRTLLKMINRTLNVINYDAFKPIFSKIKSSDAKIGVLFKEAEIWIERNEIPMAIKIVKSLRNPVHRCNVMANIATILQKKGATGIIQELLLDNKDPAIRISLLWGLFRHNISIGNTPIAQRLYYEARSNLEIIRDRGLKISQNFLLLSASIYLGIQKDTDEYLDNFNFYLDLMMGFPSKDKPTLKDKLLKPLQFRDSDRSNDHNSLKNSLLVTFLFHGKKDIVKQLNEVFNPLSPDKSDWSLIYNHCIEYQLAIHVLLDDVDFYLRSGPVVEDSNSEKLLKELYTPIFDALDLLNQLEEVLFIDESTYFTAQSLSKHGFYMAATELRNKLIGDSYLDLFDRELPFYALRNGHIEQAIEFGNRIENEFIRRDVHLCMAPHLEKLNEGKEARLYLSSWAKSAFHPF